MFSLIDMLGKLAPTMNIVDVGAMALADEPAPYHSLLKPGKFHLVGFEPGAAALAELRQTAKPGMTFLPHVVGDGKPGTFYECAAPMCSSLFEPNPAVLNLFQGLPELISTVGTSPTETRRLDDLPEITAMDVLKIDVQGAEVAVFSGAERLLRDCVLVHTEVNFAEMYKGQPLFADVDAFLRARGFALHHLSPCHTRCFYPISANGNTYQGLNQTLWADAIYVKDYARLESLSPEQLLKLAVVVHECYGSFDLAQLALRRRDKLTKAGSSGLWPVYMKRLIGSVPAIDKDA